MKGSHATAEVFYTAFKALKDAEREAFIGKIINGPALREDLSDLILIEEARKARGRTVSAREYFTKRSGKKAA